MRPVSFTADQVTATLNGQKREHRIVLRPVPDEDGRVEVGQVGTSLGIAYLFGARGGHCTRVPSPLGRPGETLWVRETFRVAGWDTEHAALGLQYRADKASSLFWVNGLPQEVLDRFVAESIVDAERAGVPVHNIQKQVWTGDTCPSRWHPGTHMSLWASRLTLEVTHIGVDRLQTISEQGLALEGIDGGSCQERIERFRQAWDATHLSRGFGWPRNPYVWIVGFKLLWLAEPAEVPLSQAGGAA